MARRRRLERRVEHAVAPEREAFLLQIELAFRRDSVLDPPL